MQTKNLDGIKKIKISRPQNRQLLAQRSLAAAPTIYVTPVQLGKNEQSFFVSRWHKIKTYPKTSTVALAMALLVAFTGGMWAALNTTETEAVEQISDLSQAGIAATLATSTAPVSNELLFNTPLQDLKNYFESTSQPDIIQKRTEQLKEFLAARKSPLESEAETIAQQPHWKLILAIAFAESTLGQHCYEFNCSGIGGSNIRTYSSSKQWIVDFNRLLEKRYKDKTLEQMCGVYVQPCTQNWLMATGQILDSLQEKGIE